MRDILEKLIALFCIIVFLTFLLNHGHLDFSGVDWVANKTKEAVTSEEGQQYVEETKEISKNVFSQLFGGIKSTIQNILGIDTEKDDEASSIDQGTYVNTLSGNTLTINIDGTNKTVKLLGIKTPKENYSEAAKIYLSKIMENVSTVYLEYDTNKTDLDGNLLAYVWISHSKDDISSNMINAIMLNKGYAIDSVYLPNNKYTNVFMNICNYAKENNIGLWVNDDFNEWRY